MTAAEAEAKIWCIPPAIAASVEGMAPPQVTAKELRGLSTGFISVWRLLTAYEGKCRSPTSPLTAPATQHLPRVFLVDNDAAQLLAVRLRLVEDLRDGVAELLAGTDAAAAYNLLRGDGGVLGAPQARMLQLCSTWLRDGDTSAAVVDAFIAAVHDLPPLGTTTPLYSSPPPPSPPVLSPAASALLRILDAEPLLQVLPPAVADVVAHHLLCLWVTDAYMLAEWVAPPNTPTLGQLHVALEAFTQRWQRVAHTDTPLATFLATYASDRKSVV